MGIWKKLAVLALFIAPAYGAVEALIPPYDSWFAYGQAAQVANGGQFNPGEVDKSNVASGTPVTLTTSGTSYDLTSLILNPGQWICSAGASSTGAGTTFPALEIGISTTSATLPTAGTNGDVICAGSAGTGAVGCSTFVFFPMVTTAATYYAVLKATFTGTAPTAYGTFSCMRLY